MKFRSLLTLISMTLLIGASACSTTDNAQTDEPAEGVGQAQNSKMDMDTTPDPEEQQASEAQGTYTQQMMTQMCMMQVEGTTQEIVRLDDAVAIDFKSTGDVDDLRKQVENMAQMHKKMHGEGGMMNDVTIETEEIDDGMRMTLTPKDPSQTDKLYQMMQQRPQMMGEDGHCRMMPMEGGAQGQ